MSLKTCTKCGEEKPFEDFHKDRSKPSGRTYECKKCHKKRTMNNYRINAEEKKAQQRAYYRSNTEKIKAQQRVYNQSHVDKIRARQRVYRQAHLEEGNAYKREWRRKNPERSCEISKASQRRYPEKHKAREALHWATRSGRVTKPNTCSQCGTTGRIEGHHEDYTKPFDVQWLCSRCNANVHRVY